MLVAFLCSGVDSLAGAAQPPRVICSRRADSALCSLALQYHHPVPPPGLPEALPQRDRPAQHRRPLVRGCAPGLYTLANSSQRRPQAAADCDAVQYQGLSVSAEGWGCVAVQMTRAPTASTWRPAPTQTPLSGSTMETRAPPRRPSNLCGRSQRGLHSALQSPHELPVFCRKVSY